MAMDLDGDNEISTDEYLRYKNRRNFFDTTMDASNETIGYETLM